MVIVVDLSIPGWQLRRRNHPLSRLAPQRNRVEAVPSLDPLSSRTTKKVLFPLFTRLTLIGALLVVSDILPFILTSSSIRERRLYANPSSTHTESPPLAARDHTTLFDSNEGTATGTP